MELHSRTIEGLNGGLEVETETHPVGGAGEVQHEFTNVKREPSEPTITFIEKYGAPIQTFLYNWIVYGMMDPDTKVALVSTLTGQKPDDLLADWYSMTCMFIQPDPTGTKAFRAWLVTNMYPLGTGEIVGKKDKTAPGELSTLQIKFAGISQFNLGTTLFAQSLMDAINLANANPYLRPAFVQNIAPDVAAAAKGYSSNIQDLGAGSIITP
jgi:hypothetical protein